MQNKWANSGQNFDCVFNLYNSFIIMFIPRKGVCISFIIQTLRWKTVFMDGFIHKHRTFDACFCFFSSLLPFTLIWYITLFGFYLVYKCLNQMQLWMYYNPKHTRTYNTIQIHILFILVVICWCTLANLERIFRGNWIRNLYVK